MRLASSRERVTQDAVPKAISDGLDLVRAGGQARDVSEVTPCPSDEYGGCFEFCCVVAPQVPAASSFPSHVQIRVIIHPEFPAGDIDVYPLSQNIRDFPHQSGETGKLCLQPDYKAPHDVTRLRTYVSWAKEWLEDAAADRLLIPGDPYELPDFRRKHAVSRPVVLFQEDGQSYDWWRRLVGQGGLFEYVLAHSDRAAMVRRFRHGASGRPLEWGSVMPNVRDYLGLWLLLSDEPVTTRRKPALVWSELCERAQRSGIDFLGLLSEHADALSSQPHKVIVLVGFPIAEKVGGPTVEIHWQPILVDNWSKVPKVVPGFQANRRGRLQFALSSPAGAFYPKRSIPWGRSENLSPLRAGSRGSLPQAVRDTRIAIIGCGALGSAISDLLVRGGLRNLALFDGDILEPGNLGRHVCGFDDLYENKAVALARRLSCASAHIRVESFPGALPFARDEREARENLLSSDLWIDCSADENLYEWLNRLAHSSRKAFAHVYITFGARYLCACSGTAGFPSLSVQDALIHERDKGIIPNEFFDLPREDELVIEGPGCWHPTFSGTWHSIVYLASAFVGQLAEQWSQDRSVAWGMAVRNQWSSSASSNAPSPIVWFREFR